jgi:hypothetical protein
MSAMSKLFDLAGLKSAVANVGKEYRRLSAEVEKLRVKREDVAAAPVAKADLVAAADGWVDAEAARYREVLTKRLEAIGASTENVANGLGASPRLWQNKLLSIVPSLSPQPDTPFPQPAALMLFFGDSVKAALRREVEALDIVEGLPLAERKRELAKLDRQIGDAEEQLSRLRAEASSAGVVLQEAG